MVKVELRFRYCISLSGVLKWAEMMISTVVIGLVLWEVVKTRDPETGVLFDGETFTCVTALFTLIVVSMLLVVYFCNCHNDGCASCRCRLIATIVYTLLVIMWIAAAGVEVWLSVDIKEQRQQAINEGKPSPYGKHQYNRRPAAAAFCFINLLCCSVSLYLAKFKNQ